MKKDYSKFFFFGGLIFLIIQLLILIYNVISGSVYTEEVIVAVEELTFTSFIKTTWSSLLGTILLCFLFFRRIKQGADCMLELAGSLLWLIQLLSLYESGMDLVKFMLAYIIGIIGLFLMVITVFMDVAEYRKNNTD